jgi:endogenous inhibitor of DNA gyrase (YacG/DUF329 family)
MSERVNASWNVTLFCDCPHCGEYVDLLDYVDFWDGGGPEVCGRGDELEIPCPECGEDIECVTDY